jgi:subtilisin-like proprotein convertase family protein
VISVDAFSGSALGVTGPSSATNAPPVATPFTLTTNGLPLFGQRVGANPVLLSAVNTNGVPSQWVFYEVTNSVPNGSNVVFATFFPPNLSRSRVRDADVDLFVSMDPNLTNLSPAVLDSPATLRSIRRGGSEFITLSNSVMGDVFYVGVKAEDQQGAEFGFFAAASALPFSQRDAEGNLIVNFLPVPAPIPDGEASAPQAALMVGVAIDDGLPGQVQRLLVTNVITHDDVRDLQAVLAGPPDDLGDIRQVVLRANTSFPDEFPVTSSVVYDDSEQNDPPPAPPFVVTETSGQAAGIGGLQGFVGQSGFGLWQLTVIDNIPVFEGRVDAMTLKIEPSNTNDLGNNLTLNGDACFLDVVNIPVGATNFSVAVVVNTPGQYVDVQIRRGRPPVRGDFTLDKGATFGPGPTLGDTLSVTLQDNPPLNPGPYYVMFCNPDPVNSVNITYRYIVEIAPTPGTPLVFTNASGPVTLLDDALTNSVITVTNAGRISDVSVGVRIDHDRVSDLVLHVRSPQGTRVLLSENRGGPTGQDYGGPGPLITNLIPVLESHFDTNAAMTYAVAAALGPWTVVSNPVTVVDDAMVAHTTNRYLALTNGGVMQTLPTTNGITYRVSFQYRNETNAVVDIAGVTNVVLTGAVGAWQEFTVDFTAAGTTDILIAGLDGDLWVDTFALSEVQVVPTTTYTFFTENTNFTSQVMKYAQAPFVDNQLPVLTTNYFLPEENMTFLRGQVAAGDWILEVWDNRLGAPLGTLVDWRLEIIFNNVGPSVTPIFNGDCVTNTVAAGEVHYYAVQVPAAAMIGTNFLTSFTAGGLDLLFNQNFLPDGTQPGDFQLLTNAVVDQATLATNTVPPLVPGSVYLLAVRNNNPAETNTYELCVRFDVASIFSSAFQTASAAPGQTLYYQFNIPATAASAQFDLVNLSGAAGLVVSKSPNVPQEGNAHYSSALTGANDKQLIVTTTSMPVPLSAGVWNVGVVNKSGVTLVHTVRATTFDVNGNPDGTQWRDAELAPGDGPSGGTPVTFNTVIGDDYRVEWSGTMTNWNTLTNFTATNVITTVVDPTPASTLNQRFYRLLRID